MYEVPVARRVPFTRKKLKKPPYAEPPVKKIQRGLLKFLFSLGIFLPSVNNKAQHSPGGTSNIRKGPHCPASSGRFVHAIGALEEWHQANLESKFEIVVRDLVLQFNLCTD